MPYGNFLSSSFQLFFLTKYIRSHQTSRSFVSAEPEMKKIVEHQEIFTRDFTHLHLGPHHALQVPHHVLHHPYRPLPHQSRVLVLVHHLEIPKLGICGSYWASRDTHIE